VDGYRVVPLVLEGGQRPVAGDLTVHGCHEGEPPEIVIVDSSGATRFRTVVWNGLWFSGIPEMASYANEFAHLT
jgi:hypothetical protein